MYWILTYHFFAMKSLAKAPKLQQFFRYHCQERHYSFQIKKCTEPDCWYCPEKGIRLPSEVFDSLHYLPDPVPSDTGEYLSFEKSYGIPTSDQHRPSISSNPSASDRDKEHKSLLVAGKVRHFMICAECGKRRVVYARTSLDHAQHRALLRCQDDLMYICGDTLFAEGQFKDVLLVREGLNCTAPIETQYYAGVVQNFPHICFHCGDIECAPLTHPTIATFLKSWSIVRPMCLGCLDKGLQPKTRNALAKKRRK
jgi:hypothetical protein